MNYKFFFGNKAKAEKTHKRLISSKRIRSSRGRISKWAAEAQKCEKAIAGIDEKLSMLNGKFVRAQKERLGAQRLIWQGRLNQALVHTKLQKSVLAGNVKHNENLTAERYSS